MQRSLMLALIAVLVLGVGGGGLLAEEDTEHGVLIRTEGPMALPDFLTAVSQHLELPLVWDPRSRALQGKEVMGATELKGSREEILDGLRSLLAFYEIVVIPVGKGENSKIMLMDARQTASILRMKPVYVELDESNVADYEHRDGLFLTTTIQIENMESLRDARNALQRIVTGQNIGSVTEVPAARSFVVTDFAPNVVSIYRLLKSLDVPFSGTTPETGDREVVFRPVALKHANATEVTSTLVQHFAANAPAQRQGPQRMPQQGTADVPPVPEIRIHADARLNQVLITGMRKDVDRVLEVVKSMDQPKPETRTSVEFIRLEHIRALDAAQAISQMVRGLAGPWTDAAGSAGLPTVTAHSETNGLLIHADERAALILRRLVAEMDAPRLAAGATDE